MGNAFSEAPENLEELSVMNVGGEKCYIVKKFCEGDYDETLYVWIPEKGYFVVKKIDKNIFEDPDEALEELEKMQQKFDYEYVNKIVKVFVSTTFIYVIIKYANNGNLHDYLNKNGAMKETAAKEKFREIVKGLQYIHSKGVYHGNLKPQNILIKSVLAIASKAVIADYGLFDLMKKEFSRSPYHAPDVYFGAESYNGFKADIYSLGLLLKEMVTGYKSATVSIDCKNLIERLTNRDPHDRPSLGAILNDRWFNNTTKLYSMYYRDN